MRFRDRLARFMVGRYGNDALNQCLLITGLIFLLLSYVISGFFYYLALVLFFIVYFRMLSRNIYKRSAENTKFLSVTSPIRSKFQKVKWETSQKKTHHIYHCPNCRQKIRIPKGKGRIAITCPKCKTEFIKNS